MVEYSSGYSILLSDGYETKHLFVRRANMKGSMYYERLVRGRG